MKKSSLSGQYLPDNDGNHSFISLEAYNHDQTDVVDYPIVHLDPSNIVTETIEDSMKLHYLSVPRLDHVQIQFLNADDSDVLEEQHHSEMPSNHAAEARLINSTIRRVGVQEVAPEPAYFGYTRPEFLFVRVFKPSRKASLGMSLKRSHRGVYITRLESGGFLERANLRRGDRIVSVNGVSCHCLDARKIAKIIKQSRSEVSIVAHNKGGNAGIVSNSVQKQTRTDRLGVSFRSSRDGLYMSKVREDGLFAGSLLLQGHRCLMINDFFCPMVALSTAAQIVADTSDLVTITSQPQSHTAMVLACNR